MAVNVETLDKLERRITLAIQQEAFKNEIDQRLKKLARTMKADGFRPGKVPMNVVAQRYGYSVHYEVINDQVGKAFAQATAQAQLRVAGQPKIVEKEGETPEGQMLFDATFEVYPEVKIGDISTLELERIDAPVDEDAIDRTVEILRHQHRTFQQRSASEAAVDSDRVTIDFEGKIDGVPFEGGKAQDFQFSIGEGKMLASFEQAVRGMKTGVSKTFPMTFPEDYHGKDVAGKEADFLVTLKKVESVHLPEVNEDFIQRLGLKDTSVEAMREDIKKNLAREVKSRSQIRNKGAALEALLQLGNFDVPQSFVSAEVDRMIENTRNDLKARGMKEADKLPIPPDTFVPQAERRVRLGLMVAELVRTHQLQAKPEQLRAQIEEMALSYEQPQQVIAWYMSDRQRMAEVEALVVESNVIDYIFSQCKVNNKTLSFSELMEQQNQA